MGSGARVDIRRIPKRADRRCWPEVLGIADAAGLGAYVGAVTRSEIAELSNRDEGDEHWFAGVCADITNGASVDQAYANLCVSYNVTWGAVAAWINAPAAPERRKQWDAALEARKQLRIERAQANVAEISQKRHAVVKPSDTLRAAEIILETGVSERGAAVSITIIHESA